MKSYTKRTMPRKKTTLTDAGTIRIIKRHLLNMEGPQRTTIVKAVNRAVEHPTEWPAIRKVLNPAEVKLVTKILSLISQNSLNLNDFI